VTKALEIVRSLVVADVKRENDE